MLSNEPTHLDLFSGIGGFALAARWAGFRTIGFCEIDKYCQKVLAKNFLADPAWNSKCEQGHQGSAINVKWDSRLVVGSEGSPRIFPDIFDLDGTLFRGVTLITGGFPCQPFSVAGRRRGAADDRAIWPEMFRVIKEARPAWVLGENVPGIIPMELDNVLSDLESIGYATLPPFVIPACAVDARHRRDRLWIVAHAEGTELLRRGDSWRRGNGLAGRSIANTDSKSEGWSAIPRGEFCEWQPEPDMGRVAHGIPSRVDRLKGLGNAIVPAVAYELLREIRKLC